jgi:hypothetical protein
MKNPYLFLKVTMTVATAFGRFLMPAGEAALKIYN